MLHAQLKLAAVHGSFARAYMHHSNFADQQSCDHQDALSFDTFPMLPVLAAALLRHALHARPNEGSLRFNVEFSPMASPNFEPGRPTENANELARLIERGLRETKAVDLEALCVLAGRKVKACLPSFHT